MSGRVKWYGAFAPIYQSLLPEISSLGRGCLVTYLGLASYARLDDPVVYPSVRALSFRTLQSQRTVNRHLAALQGAGLVEDLGPESGRRSHSRLLRFPEVKGSFGRVPVRFSSELAYLGTAPLAVYSALCTFRNHDSGCAFPSRATLGRLLVYTKRTISKALKALAEHGFIRTVGYTRDGVAKWFLVPSPESFEWLRAAVQVKRETGRPKVNPTVVKEGQGGSRGQGQGLHWGEVIDTTAGTLRPSIPDDGFHQTDQRREEENSPTPRLDLRAEVEAAMGLPLWANLEADRREQKLFGVVRAIKPLGFPACRLLRIAVWCESRDVHSAEEAVEAALRELPSESDLDLKVRKDPEWEIWVRPGVVYFGGDLAEETKDLPHPLNAPFQEWAGHPGALSGWEEFLK